MAAAGLSCDMWGPALGAWSLGQWTTREVPIDFFKKKKKESACWVKARIFLPAEFLEL